MTSSMSSWQCWAELVASPGRARGHAWAGLAAIKPSENALRKWFSHQPSSRPLGWYNLQQEEDPWREVKFLM